VLNDPRWDRQVEARDDYYARLLIATGADIDILRRRVAEVGPDVDVRRVSKSSAPLP
jgi:hypothetical protein